MKSTMGIGVIVLAWQSVGAAQTLPSIASSRGEYVLTIPYLEYGSGASKQAYGAVMRSSDLRTFVLDGSSVTLQATLAAASDSPTLGALNGGYRLVLPRLGYQSGSSTTYYRAALTTTDLSRFALEGQTVGEVTPPGTLRGPTGVTIGNVGAATTRLSSSTRLSVTWTPPSGVTIDHYELTAAESVYGTITTATAAATDTSATIGGLKAARSEEHTSELQSQR